MKKYEYIIIGGGAAGILSAIWAASHGIKTAILEKKEKLGRKILISGSGQCNITNAGSIEDFLTKYGKNSRFLKSALYNFSPQNLINFYEGHGLKLYTREDGKIFPESKKAGDVLTLLYHLCQKHNVDIFVDNSVISIESDDLESPFVIETNKGHYQAEHLLVATGGITYKHTGSSGDGYLFAKQFGHSIIEPRPSLSPIFVPNYPFKDIAGISFKDVLVKIVNENNKKIASLKQDLLLTHRNFSGPVILNISRYARLGHFIEINFLGVTREEARIAFIKEQGRNGKKFLRKYLKTYALPERFILSILSLAELHENIKLHEITKKQRESLLHYLTEYKNKIAKIAPSGMTTVGGISLKEVKPKTMESKLKPQLYFAGEVLDIDGDTGGYSIQAAHAMGILAAQAVIKKINVKN